MEKTLQVLNALEEEGVFSRYAIGGAMAATFYVEPVLTFDLDVFVVLPQGPGECISIEGVPNGRKAKLGNSTDHRRQGGAQAETRRASLSGKSPHCGSDAEDG